MSVIDPEMDMTKDMDFIKGSRSIIYWFTDIKDISREFFKKYVQGRSFFDIGCGDGRMITLAMLCGAKRYCGVEIDEKFVRSSSMQRHIKTGDYYKMDLAEYDVIYYFLGSLEKVPPDKKGEPEFVKSLKNFKGVLMIYNRKVEHRLQKFEDNLKSEGFEKIESQGHITVYRKKI